jgi:hypothetical protein
MSQLGDALRGLLVSLTRSASLLFVIPARTRIAPLINASAAQK